MCKATIEIMDRQKLITQLFIGKVSDVLGVDKTMQLLKEAKDEFIKHDIVQVKPKKVCKGSWLIGNNCKTCKKCLDTKPS